MNFTPMPTTPSVLLVLDGSGSMDMSFGNNMSRYEAMQSGLTGTTGVVTGLQTKAYFGAALYQCQGGNNVLVNPVPRALNNAPTINTYLNQNGPAGGTPTDLAINQAVQTFTTAAPPAGSPPVIVLATDGEPNDCNNGSNNTKSQTVAAAAASYAAGIPVYVLAIAANSQHFQDVANAGQGHQTGQPNVPYYPVTNAAQLQSAFQTIINGVISCDLTLTSNIDATQASQGVVTVNGMNLTYGTDWTLVNGNTIHVQGQACTMLKASANPTVGAQFPCGAVIF
ncbi:MAG TPA: vWA domain-containing protein [Kofleriaceae bacterium]